MISDFRYITNTGISLKVNLGGETFFDKQDFINGLVKDYHNITKGYGIMWRHNETEIKLIGLEKKIIGYPSIDLNYVIAIYIGEEELLYKRPCNAIVYDADGKMHRQLCVPKLVSNHAKERKKWWVSEDKETLHFNAVKWMRDKNGQLKNVMEIREYYTGILFEDRIIDPESGTFGECVGSGLEYK